MLRFGSIVFLTFLLSASAGAATLRLEIRHLWEGEPVSLTGIPVTTAAAENLMFTRLAYLLSEPSLVALDGQRRLTKSDWVAYVDAEEKLSTLTLTDLPSGHYEGFQFHIGLDPVMDQADPVQFGARHPLNPLKNNLHWDPQGGFIYLALEGQAETGLGFSYHLGGEGYRVSCHFPEEFEVREETTLAIDFHLDHLFNGEIPWRTQSQTSTHSRDGDPVAAFMAEQLRGVFSISEIRHDSVAAHSSLKAAPNLVGTPYPFRVKNGFPIPELPEDYPLTHERVDLGASLFHEVRLSRNNSISCASCHQSEHAFTDPAAVSKGVDGLVGSRNSMPLVNLAWKDNFLWDGRAETLREQALMPIEDHLEMSESLDSAIAKLENDQDYREDFEAAFGTDEINGERIGIAIEQFLLTLTSYDSKFDRARLGEDTLTEQEQRGLELFMTEFDPRRGLKGADCFHCHSGPFFSTHRFHNNGLPLTEDFGLSEISGYETDRGKFVTPSLRNVELTAPYMHDGRFETLEEVVEHYASGIERSETLDPNLSKHPGRGIPLSTEDKSALVAFLKTLTDEQFVVSNP